MIELGNSLVLVYLLAGIIECIRADVCGGRHLLRERGTISSPSYPRTYPYTVECNWTILKPPKSRLTLFIIDLDINEDEDCRRSPCCDLNHLALPVNDSEPLMNYCGQHKPRGPIHLKKSLATIKYKSSSVHFGSRGFNLTYVITLAPGRNEVCRSDEFHCHDHVCIPGNRHCDGISQCNDASDELGCPNDCTSIGKIACDPGPGSVCFDRTQRCNGMKDCPSGIDEYGCEDGHCEHKCLDSTGCFSSEQQCDSIQDCNDFTDELGCGSCKNDHAWCTKNHDSCFLPLLHRCDGTNHCPEGEDEAGCGCEDTEGCIGRICSGSKKLCNNAKCVHPSLWCDGNDDCGDNSDEDNCIRNSVISATIMGCLFCGLMLVIAVMCALRIYSIRHEAANYRLALPQHIAARLSMTNSISLPAMDDEFFHREPPPAYSVAVGQGDLNMTGMLEVDPGVRRTRGRRHRTTRPLVKPPTPPPSSETSTQSSPSRDSITSSSYLSNDDSAHLIGT